MRGSLPWRWLGAAAVALACAMPATAASSATVAANPAAVSLEAMTSPELAARIAAGATTAIIPIGGTEQNGPYMTLGKHNVRAQLLATRIAVQLHDAIDAPVVAYVPEGSINPPAAHMRFAGTLTVPAPVFEALLTSTAESLRKHGFRDIVFLSDHGGYLDSVQRVASALNRRWAGTAARAHALPEYYRAATTAYATTLAQHGISAAESGTHAGLADTALMLALDPSTVRSAALRAPAAPASAPGVYGDPRRATAELGVLGVNAIVTDSVAAIRAATVRR